MIKDVEIMADISSGTTSLPCISPANCACQSLGLHMHSWNGPAPSTMNLEKSDVLAFDLEASEAVIAGDNKKESSTGGT